MEAERRPLSTTLTYQIGTLPDSSIHLRISKNTGVGFFSDEWVSLKDIQKVLSDGPEGQTQETYQISSFSGFRLPGPECVNRKSALTRCPVTDDITVAPPGLTGDRARMPHSAPQSPALGHSRHDPEPNIRGIARSTSGPREVR